MAKKSNVTNHDPTIVDRFVEINIGQLEELVLDGWTFKVLHTKPDDDDGTFVVLAENQRNPKERYYPGNKVKHYLALGKARVK
jgi:hypothetical protein